MLFEQDEPLELKPRRTKTLLISIGFHLLLVAVVAFNPEFFTFTPKRIIRIAGQDYDLSKTQLTELVMPPPEARPKPPVQAPLVQPPAPQPQRQPPPVVQPPPPPPPPPQNPPVTISPEDVIAEGARPDAQPKASRGDTNEAARAGGSPEPPKPEPAPRQSQNEPPQIARNTNPNALRLPNILDSAGRIVDESIEESRRRFGQGPRTGVPGAQIDPNFSTEEPTILSDTRGYDFGPYMNGVVNRVRINWYSLIPEIARLGKRGRVVITFMITKDGSIEDVLLRANSGTDPLDRAALGAITASNPFARLPSNFSGDNLVLQFTFLYNIR